MDSLFCNSVMSAFQFLMRDYPFFCIRKESTFVRFESNKVFVNVFHGRLSYRLGVEIGLLPDKPEIFGHPYNLNTILDCDGVKEIASFQCSNEKYIPEFVDTLAHLLQKYGARALNGDVKLFDRLKEYQKKRNKQYALNMTRADAEQAWQDRDYKKVIQILEEIDMERTHLENKKLAYAKKKIAYRSI